MSIELKSVHENRSLDANTKAQPIVAQHGDVPAAERHLSASAAAFVPTGVPTTEHEGRITPQKSDSRGRGAIVRKTAAQDNKDSVRIQGRGTPRGGGRGGRRGGRSGDGARGDGSARGSRGDSGGRGRGGLSQAFDRRSAERAGGGSVGAPAGNISATANASAAVQRGQLANHLLNFQRYDGRGQGGRGVAGRRPRSGPRSAPYDRNKFLAANFRFMVSDAANLAAASADADLPLDWDDIIQVDMQVLEELVCPIALGPPVAPQITPCGHVFSFPSIVQHLVTHGGDNFRRTAPCPLCFSQIAARELRLLTARSIKHYQVGDEVEFTLLKRPWGSIIPHEVAPPQPPPVPAKPRSRGSTPGSSPTAGAGVAAAAWMKPIEPSSSGQSGQPAGATGGSGGARWRSLNAAAAATSAGEGRRQEEVQRCDRFAKFTIVGDPAPLWREAAEELAHHAAQVTSEGGPDAAVEAPYIWIAQDLLAARAAGAAERRQRSMLANTPPGDAEKLPSPQEAGALAARAVKQVSTAAAESAAEAAARTAHAAAVASAFPALAPASQHSPVLSAEAGVISEAAAPESAFSDEDAAPTADTSDAAGAAQPAPLTEPGTSLDSLTTSVPGTSPPMRTGSLQAAGSTPEQFFYQAADGQALFLAPLPARILAAAGGGTLSNALPHVTGRILELEIVTQTLATRRRFRTLSHVPVGGTFTVAEVDLSAALPTAALEPFAEELAGREARRKARAAADDAAAAKEAAADRAAMAATMGPSEAELKAMPRPGMSASVTSSREDRDLATALAESVLLEQQEAEEAAESVGSPTAAVAQPSGGVSFASMARLGFAATGPTLGSSQLPGTAPGTSPSAWGGGGMPKPVGVASANAWGSGGGSSAVKPSGSSAAAASAAGRTSADGPVLRPFVDAATEKGRKKGKPVLLFSSGQRRYA